MQSIFNHFTFHKVTCNYGLTYLYLSTSPIFFFKQEDVLEFSGVKRLLEMAVEGFSCTAFCYGQTGSGKTHTLTGPPGLVRELKLDLIVAAVDGRNYEKLRMKKFLTILFLFCSLLSQRLT